MAKNELTFSCYMSIDGGEPVPFEDLTPEQIEYCEKKMSERLSRNMSTYYSNHLDEFEKLKGAHNEKKSTAKES